MANDEPQTSGEDKNNRNGISFIFLHPKLKKKSQISKQRESSIAYLECYSRRIRKIIMSDFLMREVNNLNEIGTLLDF